MITSISSKAKDRFCKDCGLAIRIFVEPYFQDRLALFDSLFGTLAKWELFKSELSKYNCEQDYFEEYNRIKDRAIDDIKGSEAFQRFNSEDMNKFSVSHKNMPAKDIFKQQNDGRSFISIDIKKANFTCLQKYDKQMFNYKETWEDFISQYTENRHIIQSKYIRQVILGNCNAGRHITYEKHLMDKVLTLITNSIIDIKNVVFFSNDEIVVDIEGSENTGLRQQLDDLVNGEANIFDKPSLRIEEFTLHKIEGIDGYYKRLSDWNIELKCIDNYMMPFVLRKFSGQAVTESDKVFYHEGLLAKFIEVPEISI